MGFTHTLRPFKCIYDLNRSAGDLALTDSQRYPGVVTLPSTDMASILQATKALLDRFSWLTVTVLCDDLAAEPTYLPWYAKICRDVSAILRADTAKYNVNTLHFDGRLMAWNQTNMAKEVLQETKTLSRSEKTLVRMSITLSYSTFLFESVHTILLQIHSISSCFNTVSHPITHYNILVYITTHWSTL